MYRGIRTYSLFDLFMSYYTVLYCTVEHKTVQNINYHKKENEEKGVTYVPYTLSSMNRMPILTASGLPYSSDHTTRSSVIIEIGEKEMFIRR
jgi:hypothetical protein